MRDDSERLKDILKAIDQILSKTAEIDPHSRGTKCSRSG